MYSGRQNPLMFVSRPQNYTICPSEMRTDASYIRDYILLANFLVMALVPFLVLSLTNSCIYRSISRASRHSSKTSARQKRDKNIAMILVGIVLVFSFCNIFRLIINIYEVRS